MVVYLVRWVTGQEILVSVELEGSAECEVILYLLVMALGFSVHASSPVAGLPGREVGGSVLQPPVDPRKENSNFLVMERLQDV